MKRSVVGQFKDVICFDQLGEELVKGGMNMLRARYLGDNLALLTPKEGEDMEALISYNKDWFDSVFVSMQPLTEATVADHRNVWVRCYGLPISLWNKDCFEKVVGEEASLVSIDVATLTWENLEFARLQVRTFQNRNFRWMKNMRINDLTYNTVMEEESPSVYGGTCKCNLFDSSDSVSS